MREIKHFQNQLDRYGSNLANWPERERRLAAAVLTRSEDARAALAQAEAFDRDMLNAAPDARVAEIRRAVLDALPAHRLAGQGMAGRVSASWWSWIGGFSAAAASLVLCFYLGTASPEIWPGTDQATDDGAYAEFDSMLFGIGFDGGRT